MHGAIAVEVSRLLKQFTQTQRLPCSDFGALLATQALLLPACSGAKHLRMSSQTHSATPVRRFSLCQAGLIRAMSCSVRSLSSDCDSMPSGKRSRL